MIACTTKEPSFVVTDCLLTSTCLSFGTESVLRTFSGAPLFSCVPTEVFFLEYPAQPAFKLEGKWDGRVRGFTSEARGERESSNLPPLSPLNAGYFSQGNTSGSLGLKKRLHETGKRAKKALALRAGLSRPCNFSRCCMHFIWEVDDDLP